MAPPTLSSITIGAPTSGTLSITSDLGSDYTDTITIGTINVVSDDTANSPEALAAFKARYPSAVITWSATVGTTSTGTTAPSDSNVAITDVNTTSAPEITVDKHDSGNLEWTAGDTITLTLTVSFGGTNEVTQTFVITIGA